MTEKNAKPRAFDLECPGGSPKIAAETLIMLAARGGMIRDLTYGCYRALSFGAAKHGEENFRSVPDPLDVYAQAMARHCFSKKYYPTSPEIDEESGLPHLWHAIACAILILELS